jgi:hypothetical protein
MGLILIRYGADAYNHEGYAAQVLNDGSLTSAPTADRRHRPGRPQRRVADGGDRVMSQQPVSPAGRVITVVLVALIAAQQDRAESSAMPSEDQASSRHVFGNAGPDPAVLPPRTSAGPDSPTTSR